MKNYNNINEVDNNNKSEKNQDFKKEIKNKNGELDDDYFNDQYNLLYDSNLNINPILNMNLNSNPNTMKSADLNLEKELAQSKINININEEKNFLKNSKLIYSCDNKNTEIEQKFNKIYQEMNKNELNILIKNIEKCQLEEIYNHNPRELSSNLGTLSSLNFLIETTYYSQPNRVNIMFADKKKLEPYLYKYRTVRGDGNCFYRGLIFSFLENIILTNNIMLMKEFLILFNEKFGKNNPLLNQKEYLKDIKDIKKTIVIEILYHIIDVMENKDTNLAYIILFKVFLYCKSFDYLMIYFTRYLIYEYISVNEKQIYSRENQVEVGCLLPEDFVVDKGDKNEYFYENFYSLQLMKPKTFAEKIVIYISPFVFNCNLNILIYDYGENSFIQEKSFHCDKNALFEINLLFRKSHYDVYYKKNFYEKFSEKLDLLQNIMENLIYLNPENQEKIQKNKMKNIDNNQDNNQKEENVDNYEKIFAEQERNKKIQNNKDNSPQCITCKTTSNLKNNSFNIFGLCNDCLLNELKSQIISLYFNFLQNVTNLHSFFKKKKCTIGLQQDVNLIDASNNSDYKFEDLLLEIRKEICLYCGSNIKNEKFFIELPCNCRICSKECFDGYFNLIEKKLIYKKNEESNLISVTSIKCPCEYIYDLNGIFYMIKKMEENNLKEKKEIYQNYIKNYWKWKCMKCGQNFNPEKEFFRILFKDDNIDKNLLNDTKLHHSICYSCINSSKIEIDKKNQEIDCNFCKSKHIITEIKSVNDENETINNCLII